MCVCNDKESFIMKDRHNNTKKKNRNLFMDRYSSHEKEENNIEDKIWYDWVAEEEEGAVAK